MDVLNVGEKSYIKASVIARDLGYTADYVGQLCRAGKVDAKLVGRSWYVAKESINEHKSNRYRSTHAKTIASINDEKQKSVAIKQQLPVSTTNRPFHLQNAFKPAPKYATDATELIPLPINTPDDDSVTVSTLLESDEKNPVFIHKIDSSKKKDFVGRGVENENANTKNTFKNIPISSKKKLRNSAVIAPLTTVSTNSATGTGTEVSKTQPRYPAIYQKMALATVFVFAIFISVLLLGTESIIFVSGQTMIATYDFDPSILTAATYTAFSLYSPF